MIRSLLSFVGWIAQILGLGLDVAIVQGGLESLPRWAGAALFGFGAAAQVLPMGRLWNALDDGCRPPSAPWAVALALVPGFHLLWWALLAALTRRRVDAFIERYRVPVFGPRLALQGWWAASLVVSFTLLCAAVALGSTGLLQGALAISLLLQPLAQFEVHDAAARLDYGIRGLGLR